MSWYIAVIAADGLYKRDVFSKFRFRRPGAYAR